MVLPVLPQGFPGAEIVLMTDSVAGQGVSAPQGAPTRLALSTLPSFQQPGGSQPRHVDSLGQMNLGPKKSCSL